MLVLPRVDTVEFYNIPVGSALASVVFQKEDPAASHDVSSIMDLTKFANWDEYNMSLSGANRRSRKRKRKKLEALGPLGFAVHTSGTKDFDRVVATAMEMKAVWLQETGKASRAFDHGRKRRFSRQYSGQSRRFLPRSRVRVDSRWPHGGGRIGI